MVAWPTLGARRGAELDMPNFYEKALFVKVDVATDRSVANATALPFALCFYPHFRGALSWWLCASWDPSFLGLLRRCCHLPSGLPGGWAKFAIAQSPHIRSEALSRVRA